MGRKYTWAFIDTNAAATATSPEGGKGAIQYNDPAMEGTFTGSGKLIYNPTTENLLVTGTIRASGDIYAQNYIVENVSIIDLTGSTKFGDSSDDNHEFTGSMWVSNKLYQTGQARFGDEPGSATTAQIYIGKSSGGNAIHIEKAGSNEGVVIETDANQTALRVKPAAQASGQAVHIDTDGITAGTGLLVGDDGSTSSKLTTGNLAKFYSNSTDTNSRSLVYIHNDSTSATGAKCLKISQYASGIEAIEVLGPSNENIIRGSDEGVILGGPTSTYKGALHVYSNDDTRYPAITINAANTDDQRDARIHWALGGSNKYTLGIDDSDSDKLKFSTTSITTNTFLEANSDGEITALGDDTPALNEVLTWDGDKAVWSLAGGGIATSLVNDSGHAVISAADNVHVTLDSDDSELSYFRILDGDGFIHYSFSEQGEAIIRGHSGSAEKGAKLFLSASNSTAGNSAEITFRKTDASVFGAGDNLGSIRFQGTDDGVPNESSIVITGEVAAGSIPDASAESWSTGAQMGGELKFSIKQTGTNTFNNSLILDGLGAQIGGRLYGPTDENFIIASDKNVNIRLDEDNDTSNSFNVINGGGANAFTVTEGGNATILGDLTVTGHDILNSDSEACITMDADQRVGIGGISPAYKLDIDGDIRVRGNDIRDSGGGVAIQFDGSQNTQIMGQLQGPTDDHLIISSDENVYVRLDEDNNGTGRTFNIVSSAGNNNLIVNESGDLSLSGTLTGPADNNFDIISDHSITMQIDADGGSNSQFKINNTSDSTVFSVTETGFTTMESHLKIGGSEIRDSGNNAVFSFDGSGNLDSNLVVQKANARLDLLAENGESEVRLYGRGESMGDGANIGRIQFYGTETDGTGLSAIAAYMMCETVSSNFDSASDRGAVIKFAVGLDGTTTTDEFFFLSGESGTHGRAGIGVINPQEFLHIDGGNADTRIRLDASDGYDLVYTGYQDSTQKMAIGYDDGDDRVSISYGSMTNDHLTINNVGGITAFNNSFTIYSNDARSSIYLKRYDSGNIDVGEELGGLHFQGDETGPIFTQNQASIVATCDSNWSGDTSRSTELQFWATPSGAASNQKAATMRAVDGTNCLRLDGNIDQDAFFSEGHQYPSTAAESELIEKGDCLLLVDGELCRSTTPMQANVAGIAWYCMSDRKCFDEDSGGSAFEPYIYDKLNLTRISVQEDPNYGKYFTEDGQGNRTIYDSRQDYEQTRDRSGERSKKWIDSLGNIYDVVERQDVTEEWTPTENFKRVWKTLSLGDSRQYTDIERDTNNVTKLSGFKVCDEGGPISAGDLLCTSSKTGRLMKQPDDLMHSYTVAKAMESVSFDDDGNADGVYGYVYCG
mgnify:CR=1 FL=1